jgi:hypothetical protein
MVGWWEVLGLLLESVIGGFNWWRKEKVLFLLRGIRWWEWNESLGMLDEYVILCKLVIVR